MASKDFDCSKDIKELRDSFKAGKMKKLESRLTQLRNLHKMLHVEEEKIFEAIYKDLHKCKTEANLTEILQLRVELGNTTQKLSDWMKPVPVKRDLVNKLNYCEVLSEPLGVVLIIGAWNYPVFELFLPLIGALAAGNCAVLKPSELASHTANLLENIVPKYLNQNCVKVINGGVSETTSLLLQRFDHIFFTGSSVVGKIVMEAAAKHLTPVTLELGGKCPAIVDESCNFDVVAPRIAWAKFVASGQTCLAVDYILYVGESPSKLVSSLMAAIEQFYGVNPEKSESYGRIVNERHHKRICNLIDQSKVVYGGVTKEDDLYISPTIMTKVTADDLIMTEEIFGPLLPIIQLKSIKEAVEFVNEREKPLALYVFSNLHDNIYYVSMETSSGGLCVNDAVVHAAVPSLPFGGVGHSGMGAYKGRQSFDTFSHRKSVLRKTQRFEKMNSIRYPPYNEESKVLKWAEWMIKPTLY